MLEVLRKAWINHFAYGDDPALLTKRYAGEVAGRIRLDRVSGDDHPTDLRPFQENGSAPGVPSREPRLVGGANTTTLTVADRQGNVFHILTCRRNTNGRMHRE
jgi:hypothetical protein